MPFWRAEVVLKFNAIIKSGCMHLPLEEKDYESGNSVFSFSCRFWNKTISYKMDEELTETSSLCSEPATEIYGRHWNWQGNCKEWMVLLGEVVK